MEKEIIVFSKAEKIAEYIFELLRSKTSDTTDNKLLTIALSGGSTPRQIFQYISVHDKGKIDWKKIKLFWGDERCVPPAHADSNFNMTKKNLLDNISIPDENVFRILGENSPENEAARYSSVIKENTISFNGLPKFDLVLLGLGEDGHTASIFPGSESLFQSTNICEAVAHPQSRQQRITITGPVINNAANIIFLVTGTSKASIAGALLNSKAESIFPASFVKPTSGKLFWLLDAEAAAQSSKH